MRLYREAEERKERGNADVASSSPELWVMPAAAATQPCTQRTLLVDQVDGRTTVMQWAEPTPHQGENLGLTFGDVRWFCLEWHG